MRRQPGFTFIEAMVVLVLSGVIMAALHRTIVVQERVSRRQQAVMTTQRTNWLALELLTTGLRELSTRRGDLLMASRDSLRFRAYRDFGLVCGTSASDDAVDVVLMGESSFAARDTIVVYVDGDSLSSADDDWHTTEIGRVESLPSCDGLPLTGTLLEDEALARLHVQGAPLGDIYAGAPVRSYRSVTYGRFTVDGDWVAGRREQDDATVAVVAPLARPAERALRFRYYDSDGDEFTSMPLSAIERDSVARIGIMVRGRTPSGAPDASSGDSLVTEVFVRGT